MNVDPVQPATRREVAQLLEGRPRQRGATVAVIDEALRRREDRPVRRDARLQGRDLAGNSTAVGLLLGGDPGVDGDTKRLLHAYLLTMDLVHLGVAVPTSAQ